ncbi:hypothetical protein [Abyssisolibacter fermentans]|uniref:hypothetical protein n=1 Tax=Abyssisolibacter fermentans TaxID=1766203 RepID=UPI00082D0216|nr:hypothetical protein [Abyssisolibacter fermentans]
MEKKILELLTSFQSEFRQEVKGIRSELIDFKKEVNDEFKSFRTELTDFKQDVNNEFKSIRHEIKDVKNDLKRIDIKIENDICPKIDSLFDGYKQNTETLDRLENKVDNLSEKVEKHEVEIRVIKNNNIKAIKSI